MGFCLFFADVFNLFLQRSQPKMLVFTALVFVFFLIFYCMFGDVGFRAKNRAIRHEGFVSCILVVFMFIQRVSEQSIHAKNLMTSMV